MRGRPVQGLVDFQRVYLVGLVICLGIPIVLFQVGGVEIPLAALAILGSIPFYFTTPNTREKVYLTVAVGLSILSIILTIVLSGEELSARPFLSLVYFFGPYALFFGGYRWIKRGDDLRLVIALLSALFLLIAIVVAVEVIQSGIGVRTERAIQPDGGGQIGSALTGSLLGLTLYATWGVNSLAVYYATMFAIMCVHVFYCKGGAGLSNLWYVVGMVSLLYLIIGSYSREALLGTALFAFLSLLHVVKQNKRRFFLLGAIVLAMILVLTPFLPYSEMRTVQLTGYDSFLVERSVTALSEGRLDDFSSGRLTLMENAISDFLRNPVLGTGFYGSQLYGAERSFYDVAVEENLSPHNQYLTAVWKMGALPGVFYLMFLYRGFRNLYMLQLRKKDSKLYAGLWYLMLVYILVFCMLWDVLLVPLTGSLVMFFLGGVARIYRTEAG